MADKQCLCPMDDWPDCFLTKRLLVSLWLTARLCAFLYLLSFFVLALFSLFWIGYFLYLHSKCFPLSSSPLKKPPIPSPSPCFYEGALPSTLWLPSSWPGICLQGDKKGSICILLHVDWQLNHHNLLKMWPYFYWLVLAPFELSSNQSYVGSFLDLPAWHCTNAMQFLSLLLCTTTWSQGWRFPQNFFYCWELFSPSWIFS